MPINQDIKADRYIEVANYMFANPNAKRKDILAIYMDKFQIGIRQCDNLIARGREYNLEKVREMEQARAAERLKMAIEEDRSGIIQRNQALRILSEIATGQARRIVVKEENKPDYVEIITPNDKERVLAVQQIAKMEGWDTGKKKEEEFKFKTEEELTDIEQHELSDDLKDKIAKELLGIPELPIMPVDIMSAKEPENQQN